MYDGMSPLALESILEDRRRFATMLMLLRQPLVQDSIAKPTRLERRQAERGSYESPDVRVLTLRMRSVDHDLEDHHHVEWSHRWMVSGHWRQQWYASEQVHRPVWIAPFVKGPGDKELVIKPTVRAWRR
jgi:hypothetical protein